MTSTHRERELKFDVPVGFRLPAVNGLVGDGGVDTRTVELRSTYYDTPDCDLLAASLTLRRREGDEDTGWQLKVPAEDARQEISVPLDGTEQVPGPLVALLTGVVGERTLKPVALVRTHRTVTSLRDGDSVAAEIADDLVTGTALASATGDPAQISEWRELEVELAAGSEAQLDKVARRLTKAGAEPSSSASKLARTLDGLSIAGPAVSSAAMLVQDYLHQQARALVAGDIALRRQQDVVHKTRVAVRRVRSVLRVFAPLLDSAAVQFDGELSWYQDLLGEERDHEVQRAHFREAVAALPPELVLGPVAARIDQTVLSEQLEARTALEAALDTERYRTVLSTVVRWGHAIPLRAGVPFDLDSVRKLAAKADSRARKRLRRGLRDNDAEGLHRARKAAKRARYANEVLAAGRAAGKAARRVEQYKLLQDALGTHQDAIIAAALLRRLGATAGTTGGENGFTYGLLYEREVRAADAACAAASAIKI